MDPFTIIKSRGFDPLETENFNAPKYKLLFIVIFLLLSGCVAPVYENTTFDIEEFKFDSKQIAQGKFAVLALEKNNDFSSGALHDLSDETVIDGDELSITLHCPSRPDRVESIEIINARTGFCISNGVISLPHFPPIPVSECTLNQVRDLVESTYQEQIPSARIFVNFKKKRDRIVQIIGAAKSMVVVDGQIRLSEVLAKAQLSPYANLFKSYIIRKEEQLSIDLYKLIHQGDESQNIVMQGGDQIFIANIFDASIMVTGEVGSSIVIPIPYGFISLREALGVAGGVPFTGNKNCIQIIRGHLIRPKIYSLSWKEMSCVPNQSLLLMPGDIIVVSERPITQWNHFINQLQPSTDCMQTGCDIYRIIR